MWVSHLYSLNQITDRYGNISLYLICTSIIILILLTIRKKEQSEAFQKLNKNDFFLPSTLKNLKGCAVIFLIIGHLSLKCIEGKFLLENAGFWAVTIFLFSSGVTLSNKYLIKSIKKKFWIKRIKRIFVPLWITLVIFYMLDYLLLGKTYSKIKILSSFCGIIIPPLPNSPLWFISYILFWYLIVYIAICLETTLPMRILFTFIASYIVMILINIFDLKDYLGSWIQYTTVYPAAVFIGVNYRKISFLIRKFIRISFSTFLLFAFVFLIAYKFYDSFTLKDYFEFTPITVIVIKTFRPLFLMCFLTMFAFLIEQIKYESKFLEALGEYSYELYLLHFPFLVSYDFLLFRKPLLLFFYLYLFCLFCLSYLLNYSSCFLTKIIFRCPERPINSAA